MENITQSFLKEVYDYKNKQSCGLQLKAKYYDNIYFPPSDVQLLGQWFEYKATGQLARNNTSPVPVRLKSGKLSKKFDDILAHIEPFKKMLEEYGFKILETGRRYIQKGMQGDVDLVLENTANKKIVFGDIKTTGLINDKWSDFGWDLEWLNTKDRLMIQVVQYKMLGLFEYGYEPDFYFFIFSNTNKVDRKAIKINLDEGRLEEHLRMVENVLKVKTYAEQHGWEAHPEVARCFKCSLKDTCASFTEIPKIEEITY